jgi:hypothetical protein
MSKFRLTVRAHALGGIVSAGTPLRSADALECTVQSWPRVVDSLGNSASCLAILHLGLFRLKLSGLQDHSVEKLHSSVCDRRDEQDEKNHEGLVSLAVAHKNCARTRVGIFWTHKNSPRGQNSLLGGVTENSAYSYADFRDEEAKLGIDLSEKSCLRQMLSRATRPESRDLARCRFSPMRFETLAATAKTFTPTAETLMPRTFAVAATVKIGFI